MNYFYISKYTKIVISNVKLQQMLKSLPLSVYSSNNGLTSRFQDIRYQKLIFSNIEDC